MINTETRQVYFTPIYYILAQFSKTIRPGDIAVETSLITDGLGEDDLHVCATLNPENVLSVQLLNTSNMPINYKLQVQDKYAEINIGENSVQTVQVQL
jgi:glucosylceramidase